jgi:hypothetical protein
MNKQTASRILTAGAFLASVMIAANGMAQTSPHVPLSGGSPQQTQTNKSAQTQQNHANAERNPACQKIVSECKNLGFIVGEWKQDNGLWKDCYDPVVHGGQATRDGKSISVPVSSSDIQACRSGQHNQNNQNTTRPMH